MATEFELERLRRIESNRLKMQELGVLESAASLADQLEAAKPARQPPKKRTKVVPDAPSRRSERERKVINYSEEIKRAASERVPVDYTERIQAMSLDAEAAERLRAEMEAKRASGGSGKGSGKGRGPVDSGKGVRIQGGKVYDSKHGVTCHWCRQKTLEDHVTCTNPACGSGRRMPLSFCAKCLRNRHGEDYEAADSSGGWWCPTCRGSCGPGCVICCNCGPCRKKAGLEPTHQVVKLARDAGFGNVHDYLVHLVTGETPDKVAARKLGHSWGAWLKPDGSDASEQTGGGCGGGCGEERAGAHSEGEEDDGEQEEEQQQQEEEEEGEDTAPPARSSRRRKDQAKGAAGCDPAAKGAEHFCVSKPTSGRGGAKQPAGKQAAGRAAGGRGKRKAAAVEEALECGEPLQEQPQQPQQEEGAAALLGEGEEVAGEDAPMLSSQDTKLSRKQRIMQRMGLAPVTVC